MDDIHQQIEEFQQQLEAITSELEDSELEEDRRIYLMDIKEQITAKISELSIMEMMSNG